ncbi:hypothetical protein CCACVL1_29645, partial [Corchorus capsularis]
MRIQLTGVGTRKGYGVRSQLEDGE